MIVCIRRFLIQVKRNHNNEYYETHSAKFDLRPNPFIPFDDGIIV